MEIWSDKVSVHPSMPEKGLHIKRVYVLQMRFKWIDMENTSVSCQGSNNGQRNITRQYITLEVAARLDRF